MRQNGFTLVELAVVIVIIGILAAVALPKYMDASNKAKASELPSFISSIFTAQRIYYGENSKYADCPWSDSNSDNSNDNIMTLLGLSTPGTYFRYETDTFSTVTATVAESFGFLAKDVTKVHVTEDLLFTYEGDADHIARLKRFCQYLK